MDLLVLLVIGFYFLLIIYDGFIALFKSEESQDTEESKEETERR